ncbi:fatty acyl-CoA reductase wat-like [Copidosoma floridanum]|uniref:fatty acyl-CoA reductase wat-like n=1 Tax=Copidosoma floridanum TaxID=29053 RepID=UPI0006C9D3F7|nr:fatty acyl-CoA reductase wat-like [Copidosoma floridanum]
MVISSFREPLSGWIDNVSGPTGALVGGGVGLIRTLNIDRDCTAEMIPADLTINALISTAWDIANNKNADDEPPIYNYHSSWTNRLTWGKYVELAFKHGKKLPSMQSLWCYSMTETKYIYFHYFLILVLHMLPAIIIDTALLVTGKKAKLLKMYKKIHKYMRVTAYFSTKNWNFRNNNVLKLWDKLSEEDKEIFFFSMKDFDWDTYMNICVHGIRRFIFKDTLDTIPKAKKRMSRLVILHKSIKYAVFALFLWGLYLIFYYALSMSSNSSYSLFSESITVR